MSAKKTKYNLDNLHLNLIRGWFLMILGGIKTVEYRQITPYWCSRLLLIHGQRKSLKWWKEFFEVHDLFYRVEIQFILEKGIATFRDYKTITFANGYSKNRLWFKIQCKSICIDKGSETWGAEPGKNYFVLNLGEIKNKQNEPL